VGWIALEVVDQLVGQGKLPDWTYDVFLTWFAFGLVASAVIGWFHGEKGRQRAPPMEIAALVLLAFGALATSTSVYSRSQTGPDSSLRPGTVDGLDPSSIAVLYFDGPGGELAHLSDGLTEELIAQLSQVRGLSVVSQNGSDQFRDSPLGLDSIARLLEVGTLVRGNLGGSDGSIRVNLSVVEGASGTEVRRIAFERPSTDLLGVSDSIAAEMSEVLRVWLGEEVRVRRGVEETDNAQAWEYFQQGERARKEGEASLVQDDVEGLVNSFGRADYLWSQAEALDASWLRPITARSLLAVRWTQLSAGDPSEAAEWIESGMGLVGRALQQDPRLPEALQARGTLEYLRWALNLVDGHEQADSVFSSALGDLRAAVRFDPTLADAWSVLSVVQSQVPNLVEAKVAAQRAYEADAFLRSADAVLLRLYTTSYDLEQFPDARRYCATGRQRFPDDPAFVECELWLMASRAMAPEVDRAWQLLDEFQQLTPPQLRPYERLKGRMVVGGVIARAGLPDSARSVFQESRGDVDVDPARELLGVEAIFRVQMGESEAALELLRTYLTASPEHRFGWQWTSHWWWRDLQDDPEFIQLLEAPAAEEAAPES
jgi:TolB-like protein